jgi:hypothetical protein
MINDKYNLRKKNDKYNMIIDQIMKQAFHTCKKKKAFRIIPFFSLLWRTLETESRTKNSNTFSFFLRLNKLHSTKLETQP